MITRAPLLLLLALAVGGCGSRPVRQFPGAAEPPGSPPLTVAPAGRVVSIGGQPEGVVVDPLSGVVAVGQRGPARLLLLSLNGARLRSMALAGPPRHLALVAPGGPVLVPEENVSLLQAVWPQGARGVSSVPVGRGPHDAAASGETWFVGNEFADSVSVVRHRAVVARLPVGVQPGGVAVLDGDRLAVVAVRQRVIDLYSTTTLRHLARADAGVGPTHLRCLGPPAGGYCFVADTGGDALLIFSLVPRLELVRRIYLPGGPYAVALDPVRRALWVTLPALNQVVELSADGWQTRLRQRFAAVRQANSVAVDSASGRVFVVGRADGALQLIDPPRP